MSSGLWTAFAMLAFVVITLWVFLFKKKEDFDEQAHLPLDEEDKQENRKEKSS
ncbi:MAG: cbb3-type cytochrome c oxidase subunit 3 [Wenzhouxiangella sp.]|nr:MAG: cbb3-type cytochrome c oxidase subunit 3 [Wenzhouxiangella sp.]